MADPESSVQSVVSNDDLLTEILARLPVLSLALFKSVSKHWFSLIKEANLTIRRNLDPVSGLFIYRSYKKYGSEYNYNLVPLDIRIPIPATNFTFGPDVHGKFQILHACNGLLLCHAYSEKLIVYNPSITKRLKVLPELDNVINYDYTIHGGLRMAFDPTKSPHCKVIFAELVEDSHPLDNWVQIHTFSSETGNWSLCGPRFSPRSFVLFRNGVYWNDAIYWINDEFHGGDFFKLDIMNGHPILTASRIPLTVYRNVDNECRLFESGGCLLLGKGGAHSGHFTIYEKRNEYSQRLMKYIVNLDDIIKPFPTRWSMWSHVFIIVSEEKEDSFLVMELDQKVVQYKIVSKTLSTISDMGPNGNLVSSFPFIPSFADV